MVVPDIQLDKTAAAEGQMGRFYLAAFELISQHCNLQFTLVGYYKSKKGKQ
jgi:hypothetical protein